MGIDRENITVECFIPLPLAENQEERFYLEDPITIHTSRAECWARPMTEVHNYDGPNPRRMRAFRECKDNERDLWQTLQSGIGGSFLKTVQTVNFLIDMHLLC